MKVRSWAATDKGRMREHNEDSLLADDECRLYVVADGVGGAAAGEIASQSVVAAIQGEAAALSRLVVRAADGEQPGASAGVARRAVFDALGHVLERANRLVYERAQHDPSLKGMATTASLLLASRAGAFIGHVGDSRIYLIRGGQLHRITEDHTWAQELVRRGDLKPEDVPNFRYRNVIVRSVGGAATVKPDFLFIETQPGDTLVLCSDGLTDYAGEEAVLQIINDWGAGGATTRLIEAANKGGGGDNITVIVVRVSEDEEPTEEVAVDEQPTRRLMHTHKLAFLRNRFFFQHLTHDELMKVLRYVYEEDIQPGQVVVRQGEFGSDIYFVAEGVVDVLVDNVKVTSIGVGGHFGELALVSGEARSATVVARTAVQLLKMSQQDFYDLGEKDQGVAVKMLWAFLQTLGERVKSLSKQVAGKG